MLLGTATSKCLSELLSVMVSANLLAIRLFDGTHGLAIDKRWVNDLPLLAAPCQIQEHELRPF